MDVIHEFVTLRIHFFLVKNSRNPITGRKCKMQFVLDRVDLTLWGCGQLTTERCTS